MNKLFEDDQVTSISPVCKIAENFKLFLGTPYSINSEGAIPFFQKTTAFMMDYVKAVEKYCNNTKPTKLQHCEIVVHLMKLCSTCELFSRKYLNLSQPLEEEVIIDLYNCICKRLTALLDDFNDVICATDESKNDIGNFVKLMNVALEKISQIDFNEGSKTAHFNLDEVQNITEEVLCFSMAVGQVAMDDDLKIITAGCRLVLNALEDVRVEITKDQLNKATYNLVVDNCTDALCALEAQVNIAVLRLCLKVFSDYKQPLEDLINNTCDDILISNFDLNMDRIFQIALFSVASSAVGKGVAAIKAIMANLEFLEAELIPVIIAKTGKELNKGTTFTDLLQKVWCEQVKCLQEAIHTIIEPYAYCKLIYEELQLKTSELWTSISNASTVQTCQLGPFIKYTQELSKMVTTCLKCFRQDQQGDIKKKLKIINCLLKELKSCKALLEQEEITNAFKSNQSLFKRCQVLLKAIKQLWLSVSDESDQGVRITCNVKEDSVYEISSAVDNLQLTNIINKSRHLVKARTLYSIDQASCIMPLNNSRNVSGTETKNYSRKAAFNNNGTEECCILNDIYPIMEATFCE